MAGWAGGAVLSMASVRILYLIPSLDRSGGAEQAIAALAGPLSDRGVSLEVVTFGGARDHAPGALVDPVESAGGTVSALAPAGRRGPDPPGARARRHPTSGSRAHHAVRRRRGRDASARRAAGTPVVSSLVNVAYGPEQRANPALRPWKVEAARWIDRTTGLAVRRFHALSPHVADVMGHRLGIRRDRIDVIPRGRDAAALGEPGPDRRRRVRASLGIDDDRLLVVAAARHEYQKGLDVLVAAWPAVRGVAPRCRAPARRPDRQRDGPAERRRSRRRVPTRGSSCSVRATTSPT